MDFREEIKKEHGIKNKSAITFVKEFQKKVITIIDDVPKNKEICHLLLDTNTDITVRPGFASFGPTNMVLLEVKLSHELYKKQKLHYRIELHPEMFDLIRNGFLISTSDSDLIWYDLFPGNGADEIIDFCRLKSISHKLTGFPLEESHIPLLEASLLNSSLGRWGIEHLTKDKDK